MEVFRTTDPAQKAGACLSESINFYREYQRPILLMLSGGSAFKLLDYVDSQILDSQITLTTLDERFSTDQGVNNFDQLKSTNFYKQAVDRGVSSIDTTARHGESLEAMTKRINSAMTDWFLNNPSGVVLVTMGVGLDGHTAGILPEQTAVDFNAKDWLVSYQTSLSDNPYPTRITVTYKFLLEQVDFGLVYVVGEEKCPVLDDLLNSEVALEKMPAQIIKDMQTVKLVTDCL